MKPSTRLNLLASLIATAVGTWGWQLGFAQRLWPAHPIIADALLTILASSAVKLFWPLHWFADRSKAASAVTTE